jgi:hypothetical protein
MVAGSSAFKTGSQNIAETLQKVAFKWASQEQKHLIKCLPIKRNSKSLMKYHI